MHSCVNSGFSMDILLIVERRVYLVTVERRLDLPSAGKLQCKLCATDSKSRLVSFLIYTLFKFQVKEIHIPFKSRFCYTRYFACSMLNMSMYFIKLKNGNKTNKSGYFSYSATISTKAT